MYFCHSQCNCGGDIFDLEMKLTGAGSRSAKEEVFRIVGRIWRKVATYIYIDESEDRLFRAIKMVRGTGPDREKKFAMERVEDGRWEKGLGSSPTRAL